MNKPLLILTLAVFLTFKAAVAQKGNGQPEGENNNGPQEFIEPEWTEGDGSMQDLMSKAPNNPIKPLYGEPTDEVKELDTRDYLQTVDKNHDGLVELEEHLAYFKENILKTDYSEDWEFHLKLFFSILDNDIDNVVTTEELKLLNLSDEQYLYTFYGVGYEEPIFYQEIMEDQEKQEENNHKKATAGRQKGEDL